MYFDSKGIISILTPSGVILRHLTRQNLAETFGENGLKIDPMSHTVL